MTAAGPPDARELLLHMAEHGVEPDNLEDYANSPVELDGEIFLFGDMTYLQMFRWARKELVGPLAAAFQQDQQRGSDA